MADKVTYSDLKLPKVSHKPQTSTGSHQPALPKTSSCVDEEGVGTYENVHIPMNLGQKTDKSTSTEGQKTCLFPSVLLLLISIVLLVTASVLGVRGLQVSHDLTPPCTALRLASEHMGTLNCSLDARDAEDGEESGLQVLPTMLNDFAPLKCASEYLGALNCSVEVKRFGSKESELNMQMLEEELQKTRATLEETREELVRVRKELAAWQRLSKEGSDSLKRVSDKLKQTEEEKISSIQREMDRYEKAKSCVAQKSKGILSIACGNNNQCFNK